MANRQQWIVLVCACILAFSGNFFSQILSPLSRRLQGKSSACIGHNSTISNETDTSLKKKPDHCLALDSTEYNGLSTASTYATGVSAVLTAFALEQYGRKWLIWTAGALYFAGVFLFVGGSYIISEKSAFAVLLLGRLVFGMGNGIRTTVCARRMNRLWAHSTRYKGTYILSARMGSGCSYLLSGSALNAIGMRNSIWIAVGLIIVGTVAAIIQGFVDVDGTKEGDTQSKWQSAKQGVRTFRSNVEAVFWWFSVPYFLVHSAVQTYTTNAPTLLAANRTYTEQEAIWIVGLVYFMSIVIPFTGYAVDECGHRDWWMTFGSATILISFAACLGSVHFNSILMSAIMGLGYAIFDSVSSSSTNIVAPDSTKGTANAVVKFLRYFAVGSFALVAGVLLDQQKKWADVKTVWRHLLFLLLTMTVTATCGALVMIWANSNSKEHPLTLKEKEHRRRKREQKQKKSQRRGSEEQRSLPNVTAH